MPHDPKTLTKDRRAAIKAQVEKGRGPDLDDCGTAEAVLCRHIFAAYERCDALESDIAAGLQGELDEAMEKLGELGWTFTCAVCKELYIKGRDDGEALEEYQTLFKDDASVDLKTTPTDQVCEDCFVRMADRFGWEVEECLAKDDGEVSEKVAAPTPEVKHD